jgi:hypothetical protein
MTPAISRPELRTRSVRAGNSIVVLIYQADDGKLTSVACRRSHRMKEQM